MIPRNTVHGTRVARATPDGKNEVGYTHGEVDVTNFTVSVQWPDYSQPRTEQLDNLLLVQEQSSFGDSASPIEPPLTVEETIEAVRQWWMDRASEEVEPMLAKMREYGGHGRAFDLSDIGNSLTDAGINWNIVTAHPAGEEAGLQELGIYFYLVGKFARWKSAVAEGRVVSDDTLLDIGIYIRMAQRIRDVGGWPV